MFDFVTTHKKLIQVVLFIIFLPFAFFGIDTYFRGIGGGQAVARVGDYDISQEEFSRALRERQQLLQRLMQGRVDPAMLDSPELRYSTLETLIQRRLLLDGALRAGITVSDEQLTRYIGEQPLFRDESGRFSLARYEQYVKSESMTPVMFEARLRQDLILQQFTDGYADSGFAPRTVIERLARLSEERREVSQSVIAPDRFMGRVKLEADAAKKHYDANPGEFQIPEQVRVEYLALTPDALIAGIQLNPAEVEAAYQQQVVSARKERADARARVEKIFAEVKKNPKRFEELAQKLSQDPGSAEKGGDLGFFARGAMVKAFADAVFRLKKEGEISPIVSSEYGFHIIKLTGIRQPAGGQANAEQRRASHILITAPKEPEIKGGKNEVELALKRQVAQKRFGEVADQFVNVVYEQAESLKPAADLLRTAPQTSGWITRARAPESLLNYPRLLAAIFSDDVLRNKRNTEAIEVASGTLVAARVVAHKPESMQPFEEVRAAVEKRLAARAAARLAAEEGRRLLEEIAQGKAVQTAWSPPQLVSRSEPKGLPEPVARQAFQADISKLPAYTGVENPQGGYTLVRITRVQEAGNIPPETISALTDRLRQILGQEAVAAHVATLKQKAGVKINKEHLERKEEGAPLPAPTQSDRPAPKKRGAF